jgi:hypothetical protein
MASSDMERWSGVIFESKARNIKKYPNLNTRLIGNQATIKHARGRGKDSKHATSKNQQVERVG